MKRMKQTIEPHHFEQGFQHTRLRGCELDELEAVQAHRVFIQISHIFLSNSFFYNSLRAISIVIFNSL